MSDYSFKEAMKKGSSYLINCYVQKRVGDPTIMLFDAGTEKFHLNGYAIIPLSVYQGIMKEKDTYKTMIERMVNETDIIIMEKNRGDHG